MSIYITGDTHGQIDWSKLNTENFPVQKTMTENDLVIIAGDFGGVWDGAGSDRYTQAWYNDKNHTTAFVDGNHENHWLLNSYPVSMWNGGRIHRISKKLVHLMRGEVYMIQGKKFFVMGGADSVDKAWRKYGVSWWPEELPNDKEYKRALRSLKKHNFQVDYVVTHDCSTKILESLYSETWPVQLNHFLDDLEYEHHLQFDHWYFGHHHLDKEIDDKHTALYQKVIRIL